MVLEGVATCAAGDLGEDGDRGGEGVGSEALPELDQVRDVEPCTGALHTTSLRGWGMNKLKSCLSKMCVQLQGYSTHLHLEVCINPNRCYTIRALHIPLCSKYTSVKFRTTTQLSRYYHLLAWNNSASINVIARGNVHLDTLKQSSVQ